MPPVPPPTIDPYPVAPVRSLAVSQEAYDPIADAWAASLEPRRAQIAAVADNVYDNAVDAAGSASEAGQSAAEAEDWATSTDEVEGGLYGARKYAIDAAESEDAAAASAASAAAAPGTRATCGDEIAIPTVGATVEFALGEAGKLYAPGQALTFASEADVANRFTGVLQAGYDTATGEGELEIVRVNGTGTFDDWIVSLAPEPLGEVATQEEAEEGAVNDKAMTPLRVAQAIEHQAPIAPAIILQDRKTSGTASATLTADGWRTLPLNTFARNAASLGSVDSNVLTLPAGTYYAEWESAFVTLPNSFNTNVPILCRLFDETNAVELGRAPNVHGHTGEDGVYGGGIAKGCAYFELSDPAGVRLEAYPKGSAASNGAAASVSGVEEIYNTLKVWHRP